MTDVDFRHVTKVLEIFIAEERPTPLARLAEILTSLDNAFHQFAARQPGHLNARLAIVRIERGSLRIILDAWEAVEKIWDARECLGAFATHLADVANQMLGTSSGIVKAADRKAIEAIAAPVASGQAQQINVINNSGTIVFNMNDRKAATLAGRRKSPRRRKSNEIALSNRQIADLQSIGIEGTAIIVHGNWYARLVGGRGVLIPLNARSSVALADGQSYRLVGSITRGDLGEAVGVEVSEAIPLGRRPSEGQLVSA